MDRARFIERAPHYYVLAIKEFFDGAHAENGVATMASLQAHYREQDGDTGAAAEYLENEILMSRAIDFMVEKDLLHIQEDDFGPPLYSEDDFANTTWDALREEDGSLYGRYMAVPKRQRHAWLTEALMKVNIEFMRLELKESDFEKDAEEDEWQPLPIDRASADVQEVIKAIDSTAELVRQDNGYNATVPEERAYVLDALSAASKRFKEAQTISVQYIKTYALEPLSQLVRRFGAGAIGASAKFAKDVLYTFLKNASVEGLGALFKSLFP